MTIKGFLTFLTINFMALGIGSILMNSGATSAWYVSLNKAPWSPEGWVFGLAWSIIMVCFSIYMAILQTICWNSHLKILFSAQFITNIIWNYLFFNKHLIFFGLIDLVILTIIVFVILKKYHKKMGMNSVWISPYILWLCLACSLNFYILIQN